MVRLRDTLALHPVRSFALICVACTSAFLGFLAYKLINTLSSPRWCANALAAEKTSDPRETIGLEACMDLLMVQLKTLATNSHIVIGSFSLSLIVLVVIVLAGAQLSGKLLGNELDIRADDVAQAADAAADHVVQRAQEGAEEVRGDNVQS